MFRQVFVAGLLPLNKTNKFLIISFALNCVEECETANTMYSFSKFIKMSGLGAQNSQIPIPPCLGNVGGLMIKATILARVNLGPGSLTCI